MPRKNRFRNPPRPTGQPLSVLDLEPELRDEFIDRLILRSRKVGECIEWTGAKDKNGYALAAPKKATMVRAHKAMCEWMYGRMPPRHVAMHRCDNPSCLHPVHLRPGSNTDNQQDMTKKGRGRVGDRNGRSKLTEADVREIVRRRRAGESAYNLAPEFGVDFLAIQRIMRGEIWSHLDIDRSATEAMRSRVARATST